ncbi:DoxX family protein [Xanthobacter oligotrophicus]|uniref:DoxX family protein n=1 Tax=Xanthobacter oligotrophicus TaxID=2607286 RepID=UPI0011F12DC7|nr:DoxX family protein [Xanthobacter oligotrophicus]MCG5238064.1 DoxX family protein [Xanthobacter oligotrophicus]
MSQTNLLAAVGRLFIAFIFIASGLGKIAAPGATQGYIASAGLPLPMISYLIAVIVELAGGIVILIGYQARITGLVLAAFTLATAVIFHTNFTDQNQMIHFLKNVAIAGGLLQVAAFGAGALSLDGWRQRAR